VADFVYTIGHSTHAMKQLVELLDLYGVDAVADVRSHPYSGFNPQFNRESLDADLRRASISYVFMGHQLGARTDERHCYVDGSVDFDLLASTQPFQDGLARVSKGAKSSRIALLCAEKDPLACHRGVVVCRYLAGLGVGARHILADGQLEDHGRSVTRLLDEVGMANGDLFRTEDELVIEAYGVRGRQIAHADDHPSPEQPVREERR
jgi:uncharacterized protein (DUF488 family)